jgi:integrase
MAIARPARLLKNRHGVYCFRWIVPARLRDNTGHPRELRVSLGTRDPKVARVLGLQINLTCESLPTATRPQDLRSLVQQLAQQAATSSAVAHAASDPTPVTISREPTPTQLVAPPTAVQKRHQLAPRPIRAFVADYLASRAGLARNQDSTKDEKERTLECLLCFLRRSKHVDVDQVGIDAVRRSWLIDFVSFYAQHGAVTSDDAWNRIVEKQPALTASKGGRPTKGALAARTVIKAIGHLSDLGTYATATEALPANPVDAEFRAALKGLWEDAAAARRHAGYRPFNSPQLKAIFDPEQLLMFNPAADYFWSDLLGLFSVARLSEIVTLSLDDVFTDPASGVLVLRIRNDPDSGRRVKNYNSERLVPVCQRLLDIGFGAYVDHVRGLGATVLFPHLKAGATRAADPSKAQSRQFAKYLDHLGIVDEQLVFHSFRHTGITTMHARGVPLMDSEL